MYQDNSYGDTPFEAKGWGTPLAEYRPAYLPSPRSIFIQAAVCAVPGIFVLLWGGYQYFLTRQNSALGWAAIGLLFIIMGLVLLRGYSRIDPSKRVLIFRDGLSYTQQDQTSVVGWQDIEFVWQDETDHRDRYGIVTRIREYTIDTKSGTRLQFTSDLKDAEKLGDTLQQEVTRRLLPGALKTIEAGGTLDFNTVLISQYGISRHQETASWLDIEKVTVHNGVVQIKKKDKRSTWVSFRADQMPNLFVFLLLVKRLGNNVL